MTRIRKYTYNEDMIDLALDRWFNKHTGRINNLKTLHSQLEYAVNNCKGKTTITQTDLDTIQEAIEHLSND